MKTAEITNLLTLTPESIKDFQTCARLYDYRYNDQLYEPIHQRALMAERFENILKKVVAFYFYKKQGGSVPSYSALLNRWERLWFPKEMTAYDLAVEQQETVSGNLATYSNDAATALLKFYEDFTDDPSQPLLIDEAFTVPVRREIRLQGRFDLVLRFKDHYKIIKWSASSRRPSLGTLNIDFATLKYAFDYRNIAKDLNITYGLYDLASSKPGFVKVEVEKEDVDGLKFWTGEIFDEKVYPSRRDLTQYCKVCPHYEKPCAQWKAWLDG